MPCERKCKDKSFRLMLMLCIMQHDPKTRIFLPDRWYYDIIIYGWLLQEELETFMIF